MLNMRKLIDQTDFENLNQLTKQWSNTQKNSTQLNGLPQKQNNLKQSNESILKQQIISKVEQCPQNIPAGDKKPVPQRKPRVVPQVIDEDTQHFKNKLENLLNNFKTDAVAEFMNMKKQMLEYQQECVKSDTQKYLTLYQDKHRQLLETKQKLLETSRQAQKKTIQVQLLSDHIAKLNERMKIYKYVSRPFSILYENMVKQQVLKFKMKEAAKFNDKRLKKKGVWGWVGVHKLEKSEKQKVQNQQRIQKQVSDIVGKFQKQMEMMRQRLIQATRKNQQYENNKYQMQENLKKAFLRGVCAMNMEAMGVLGTENAEQNQLQRGTKTVKDKNITTNNLSFAQSKTTSIDQTNLMHNQSMMIPKTGQLFSNTNLSIDHQQSQNIYMGTQRVQSKNYKWKQAPILGIQQNKQRQQPRMQVVRPTTEGKVIKVIDGKSTVQVKKSPPDKTISSGSRKKI